MSADWMPPRRGYHLRVLAASLALIAVCLAAILVGVRLEDVAPATGVVASRNVHEARARVSGLVEPGWYEGEVKQANGEVLAVRIDGDGNGAVQPAADGRLRRVRQHEIFTGGQALAVQTGGFHRLQAGDVLWPGQPIAAVRDEALRLQWQRLDDQIHERASRGEPTEMLVRERDRLRDYQMLGTLRAPDTAACWLALAVRVAPLERTNAGDVLAVLVPADPTTHQPTDLVALLEIEEKNFAGVGPGQKVRLHSAIYNPRLFGPAEATIERLDPRGQPSSSGDRRFHAVAPITHAPFALPLGSSFQAEIVIGRKPVYRIILEN